MAERPILFSAQMVRAILEGRKTQTRRIVKGRGRRGAPEFHGGQGEANDPSAWGWFFDGPDHHGWEVLARGLNERVDNGLVSMPCPYGEPGDRLWVRETWGLPPRYDPKEHGDLKTKPRLGPVCFAADFSGRHAWNGGKWRPSIHMPRWASRITLEVTGVRVERLQAITEEDARAEGVRPFFEEYSGIGREQRLTSGELARDAEHRASFAVLWDTLAAGNVAAWWKSNPWVWCVEFKRVTT